MPRLSNGLFLQVLSARPQAGVPLEITVWDGAAPANMLAQLQNASDIQFQHVRSDVGSGTFRIPVVDPKATTANIREGNLVKVRLNDVDVFPYFIESPRLVVAESGDSLWELKGPGALSYTSQAVVYPPGWPTPTGGDRVWTSATAGTVLKTIIDEAQARGSLAHMTYDFTAAVDSLNDPWDANLTLTTHAGTSVLDVIKQLVALGIDVQMTPNLVLQAYKAGTFGRDLSTSVVFRSGRHIVGEVQKVGIRSQLQNGVLVEGAGGKFVEVNDPTSIADPYTGRREGGVRFTSSADPTTLSNAGTAQIRLSEADSNALSVPLNHDANPGGYTPYADYVPGDWVSLDVPGQYAMAKFQLQALTLTQLDNANYGITADLNAVAIDYLVRLRNAIAGTSGSSGGASSGSSSGSLGLGSPQPTPVALSSNPATASRPGDVAAPGTGTSAAHDDHTHGRESWGLAADVGAETFGAVASAGTTGKVADAGHVHAMPANPAPSPATTVTGPDAFGASSAVGTSALYARADHDHGLPAAPSVPSSSGTVASETTFGIAPAAGSSTAWSRGDHTHGSPSNPTGLPLALTGATAATRYVGGTTSGSPVSGTFAVGDYVVDQTGKMWVCTAAGTPGTWAQIAGGGGASPLTTKGDLYGYSTVDARIPVGSDGQVLTADSTQALGVKWAASGGGAGGGASASHPMPLDSYAIDATYGDDFTGASLSAIWTRRNFTGAAEQYQKGKAATWLRLDPAGRANGDGYFQTAPAGDWTFAMKVVLRFVDVGFGLVVVDTNGTGVGFLPAYPAHTPNAPLLIGVTTYSTYGGTYYEPYKSGSTSGPNLSLYQYAPTDIPIWTYLRKSGTNYYAAYSLDGEVWSPEAGPIAWAGTVNRIGMILLPPQTATLTNAYVDVDWFNKIA